MKRLFDECDEFEEEYEKECGEDGSEYDEGIPAYWHYLISMYQTFEVGDGDIYTDYDPQPDSWIIRFVAKKYKVLHHQMTACEFGYHIEWYETDEFVYLFFTDEYLEAFGKYKGNTESLKRIMAYAHELTKRPVITGRIYHFDWERLKESEESRKKVEKEDGPFMKEYKAVKELYGKQRELQKI